VQHPHFCKLNLRVYRSLEKKIIKIPCIVQELLIYAKKTGQSPHSALVEDPNERDVIVNKNNLFN